MPYANKQGSMAQALDRLDSLYVKLSVHDAFDIGFGHSQKITLETAYNGIQTLKGNHTVPPARNPYQAALDDDAYLTGQWLPLALAIESQLQEGLQTIDVFSIASLFVTVSGETFVEIKNSLPSSTEATVGLGFIAIGLVAIAVIVVMK